MENLIFTFTVTSLFAKGSFHSLHNLKDDLVFASCCILQDALLPHLVFFPYFGGDLIVTKYPAQLSFKLLKAKQETLFQLVCFIHVYIYITLEIHVFITSFKLENG